MAHVHYGDRVRVRCNWPGCTNHEDFPVVTESPSREQWAEEYTTDGEPRNEFDKRTTENTDENWRQFQGELTEHWAAKHGDWFGRSTQGLYCLVHTRPIRWYIKYRQAQDDVHEAQLEVIKHEKALIRAGLLDAAKKINDNRGEWRKV